MPQFAINGTVWTPRINCFVMRQFEDQFSIPFSKAGQLLAEGRIKPILTLAFFSVGSQAAERNVTLTQFERSIETAEQFRSVSEAVGEALMDFFQIPAIEREAPRKAGLEAGNGETSTK